MAFLITKLGSHGNIVQGSTQYMEVDVNVKIFQENQMKTMLLLTLFPWKEEVTMILETISLLNNSKIPISYWSKHSYPFPPVQANHFSYQMWFRTTKMPMSKEAAKQKTDRYPISTGGHQNYLALGHLIGPLLYFYQKEAHHKSNSEPLYQED